MKRHFLLIAGLGLIVSIAAALHQQNTRLERERAQANVGAAQAGQQQNGRDRERGGDRGGPGGGWQQRFQERLRESLNVSDEEWQVIQPKIEKVQAAQRNRGGFGGFGGGRRGGGGDGQGPDTPVTRASNDLRTTLENQNASADEVAQKLEALRAARKQAEADLNAAREDLKSVLTQRQEASLVLMGILE